MDADGEAAGARVAIIGAGPAGVIAATTLHRAGHPVVVLERARFPRFVIGESLLPSCMDHLQAAGLLDHLATQGYLEKRGIAIVRKDQLREYDFGEQSHDGWRHTWQVKRAEFDSALVAAAERQGVGFRFGREVTGFAPPDADGGPTLSWRASDGAEHRRRFDFVIDASGYGRVLPRLLDLERPSTLPRRKTVFAHVRGDLRPPGDRAGFSWAVCHEDAWIWVIPFVDGATSVGVVALPGFFERMPADPEACLRAVIAAEPNLARRLPAPEMVFPPRTIENYSADVIALHGPGYCLVGNAGEFLDPIFSSGISLALASGRRAAACLDRALGGATVDWASEFAAPVRRGIDVFRDYVTWWYEGLLPEVFFAEASPRVQAQICSVLAGYVWDDDNPFVVDRRRKVPQLLRVLAES